MESILWGLVKCGLYKQVVYMYKWSLGQVPRYMYKGETLVDMLILMFAVDFCNK